MTKVAAIQMCSTDTLNENLAVAATLIEKAAAHDATLTVLPEMFAIIGQKASDKVDMKLGLCVCYDMRLPQLFAELSAKGAEVIAVPSAFTMKTGRAHWEILARCRAIDTFCYVLGSCQGGVHSI